MSQEASAVKEVKTEKNETQGQGEDSRESRDKPFCESGCFGCFCILLSIILGFAALWIGLCAWMRCCFFPPS